MTSGLILMQITKEQQLYAEQKALQEEKTGKVDLSTRTVKYNFGPDFLKLKTIGLNLTFEVLSDTPIQSLKLFEKHFFLNQVVRDYEFDMGFCMPKSTNSVEFIYDLPKFEEEDMDMILSQPWHGYAMQGYFVTSDKRQRDAWESKGTHFSMGQHPRINASQQKHTFADHTKSLGQLRPIGSRSETTASNYQIGDPRQRNAYFMTTYNQVTDARKYEGYEKIKKIDNKNFSSSITYGASKPQIRLSQNTVTYTPHVGFKQSEQDKEFIKHIKSNHFEFGNRDTNNSYVTMNMSAYNFKGRASDLRAQLDQSKKEDLRRSHFNVGQTGYPMVTQSQATLTPMKAQFTPLNAEKRAELRASHWGIGERPQTSQKQETAFITNNMLNYRWIQPAPRRG